MISGQKIREIFEWIAAIGGFLSLTVLLIAVISGMVVLILHA